MDKSSFAGSSGFSFKSNWNSETFTFYPDKFQLSACFTPFRTHPAFHHHFNFFIIATAFHLNLTFKSCKHFGIVLKNLEDDSHCQTRIGQYQALTNGKGIEIAKQILICKIEGQNQVLKKYGLRPLDFDIRHQVESMEFSNLESARKKLMVIESHNAKMYFKQIFGLFPENIRPERRTGFKAYDGLNNVFNFGYYVLKCRVHKALLKAKLEPYLGFLHSVQVGKPSLVCDFQELYRYLIDDYLIDRCRNLHKKDFVLVNDFMMRLRTGKRIHLCEYETDGLAEGLNELFDRKVDVARMRNGSRSSFDTLINEEAYLLAQYLRNEKESWIPRIATLT